MEFGWKLVQQDQTASDANLPRTVSLNHPVCQNAPEWQGRKTPDGHSLHPHSSIMPVPTALHQHSAHNRWIVNATNQSNSSVLPLCIVYKHRKIRFSIFNLHPIISPQGPAVTCAPISGQTWAENAEASGKIPWRTGFVCPGLSWTNW